MKFPSFIKHRLDIVLNCEIRHNRGMAISVFLLVMASAFGADPVSLTPKEVFDANQRILDVQYEAAKKNGEAMRPGRIAPADRAALNEMREFVIMKSMLQTIRKSDKESAAKLKKKIANSPAYLKIRKDLEAQKAARPNVPISKETPINAQKNDGLSVKKVPLLNPTPREEIVIDGSNVPNEIEFPEK